MTSDSSLGIVVVDFESVVGNNIGKPVLYMVLTTKDLDRHDDVDLTNI